MGDFSRQLLRKSTINDHDKFRIDVDSDDDIDHKNEEELAILESKKVTQR
jgi:polyphosphate kinase